MYRRPVRGVYVSIALLAVCCAHEARRVVQEDGSGQDVFSLPFVPDSPGEKVVSATVRTADKSIITDSLTTVHGQNITVLLDCEGGVGPAALTVVVETEGRGAPYEFPYQLDVIGIAFSDSAGALASGEHGTGIVFDGYAAALRGRRVEGLAYAGGGSFVDLSDINIVINDVDGSSTLDVSSVAVGAHSITVTPKRYRVGKVRVEIEHPGITYEGETPMTVLQIVVGDKNYPNPVVLGLAGAPPRAAADSRVSAGSARVAMVNLVNRPDTGKLVTVRAVVSKNTLFVMDPQASSLGASEQEVVFMRSNVSVPDGDYRVQVEAEYDDGKVLPAIQESPLVISVVGGDQSAVDNQTIAGPSTIVWALAVGIAGGCAFVVGIAALVMWKRSVAASDRVESSYAGSYGVETSRGGSQAFGVPVPTAADGDGIVRDSYARNDSMFSSDTPPAGGTNEGPEECTSSWFHRTAELARTSDYPSSNFSV